MNDEELREALRAPSGIEPLDPAYVIAGARRRRKRSLVTGGAAAVAVLAVVGASVLAGTRPTGLPVVEQSTPSPGTPKPSRAAQPKPPKPDLVALVKQCKLAVQRNQELVLEAKAAKQASLSSPRGTLIVLADSKHWTACDNGYRPKDPSVRRPVAIRRPALSDIDAFAVAGNELTKAGKTFDYYWAAGMLPAGVATVSYTFPGGSCTKEEDNGK